ncbi:hypothetical protein GCM10027174_33430 [Salinifilum aidingensis]
MPAINVTFDDDQMEQLRCAAAAEGKSVKAMANEAVLAELHRRKVAASAARVGRISSDLNERLAQR